MKNNYQNQINRIEHKISLAKKKDKDRVIFGASSHRYEVQNRLSEKSILIFEQKYNIELPKDYKSFITQIGNEGKKYSNEEFDKSFCGPFYGIYSLEHNNDVILDKPIKNFQEKFILDQFSDEEWEKKREQIWNLPDEEYDYEIDKLFSGILPIGTQGCTFYTGLILNGAQKGKVIYIDLDLQKPFITYEDNFLDWYERWLDEIISGQLFSNSGNFGYTMGGSESELFNLLSQVNDQNEIIKILNAILKLLQISKENGDLIKIFANSSNLEIKKLALYILAKLQYEIAKPFLRESITDTDDEISLIAVQSIYWYANDRAKEWVELIVKRLKSINSENLLDFSFYILTETKYNYEDELLYLLKNENIEMRKTAFYNLSNLKNLKNRSTFEKIIKDALQKDTHINLLIQILQSIGDLNKISFISHYKALLKRIPNNMYLISNIINLVEELGLEFFDEEFEGYFKEYFDQIEFSKYDNTDLLNTLIDFSRIKSKKLLKYAMNHQDKEVRERAKEYFDELN